MTDTRAPPVFAAEARLRPRGDRGPEAPPSRRHRGPAVPPSSTPRRRAVIDAPPSRRHRRPAVAPSSTPRRRAVKRHRGPDLRRAPYLRPRPARPVFCPYAVVSPETAVRSRWS